MKNVIEKFEPDDVIVWTVIVVCVSVISFGKDGVIKDVLLTVCGFYFGDKRNKIAPTKKPGDSEKSEQ